VSREVNSGVAPHQGFVGSRLLVEGVPMAASFAALCLIAGINLWFGALAPGADTPKRVTDPEERAAILDALKKDPQFAAIIGGKRKVVPSTMVRYRHRPEGAAAEAEFVKTLHFDYDTGKTIHTVYNMTEKRVTNVETLEAYPTPLAAEEKAVATKLAEAENEDVKDLFRKYKEQEVTIQALAPVIADKAHKHFGKRLAILVLSPKGNHADTVTVTVNLTDKAVPRE
jgi:hypothetical protein